jgi:hypothetical protein
VRSARGELRRLREQRAAVGELEGDRDAHAHALGVQAGRLGLIDALETTDEDGATRCVVCGNPLQDADETARTLAQAAAALQAQITELRSAALDGSAAEHALDELIAAAEQRVQTLRAQLEASVDADEAARSAGRAVEQQAYLRGIIAEHLRVAELAGSDQRATLTAQVAELQRSLSEVREVLDTESVNQRVNDRLDAAAVNMTEWARRLELEWADEGLVRIDRRELTVAVQRPADKVLLSQIGSGANHVGYHIVAHLALHDFFVNQDRPVPRFLILDQPSLPFFPSQQASDAEVEDVDWQAVKHFFELARDVTSDLSGKLQVLITDHAMYRGERWFDDALIADWHDRQRLVPEDWPEQTA